MWRLRAVALILSLLSLKLAARAQIETSSFATNARTFETIQSSLLAKGMAHACLTVATLPDSIPCNPALTTQTLKPRLGATGMLSNGYSTLDKMQRLLKNDLSQEQINILFSSNRQLQIEGNAELTFNSKYFAAKYTPYNIKRHACQRQGAR